MRCSLGAVLALAAAADYYVLLGVRRDASEGEIKKAFRRIALEAHPDKMSDKLTEAEREAATDRFIELTEAYEVLSDGVLRQRYDLGELHERAAGPGAAGSADRADAARDDAEAPFALHALPRGRLPLRTAARGRGGARPVVPLRQPRGC